MPQWTDIGEYEVIEVQCRMCAVDIASWLLKCNVGFMLLMWPPFYGNISVL